MEILFGQRSGVGLLLGSTSFLSSTKNEEFDDDDDVDEDEEDEAAEEGMDEMFCTSVSAT